jgi:membrane-bound lytic murein transglycosylase D
MNRKKVLPLCAIATLLGSAALASDPNPSTLLPRWGSRPAEPAAAASDPEPPALLPKWGSPPTEPTAVAPAAAPAASAPPPVAATLAVAAPVAATNATVAQPADPTSPGNAGEPAETGASEADAPDEIQIQREVQAESADLEQVRLAEEKARLGESTAPDDAAARAASRLGLESPLRLRLRDAFGRETGPGSAEPAGRIAGLPEIDHDLRRLQAEYDIPIEVNESVIAYTHFFQAPSVRKHFVKWLGRSSKYIPTFRRIMREQGLPEDTVYLAMIESGFANLATSRAKAVGPWQFIPATGKRMGLRQDFWVDERRDPEKAARAAAKYLKELYRQTGDWRLAWAGYNAGVGKIFKARAKGQLDFWTMARGRVLKSETKGYVPKLMACAIVTKHAEAFGFTKEEIEPERWQEYEEVSVPHATPFSALASAAEVPEKALLDLNPELRRTCTPPRSYSMKLPRGQAEVFARNWPKVSEAAGKLAFAQHRVGRGESLKVIANNYHVDQATIVHMNGLRPGRHIKPGTELVIPLNALARSQGVAFASAERAAAVEKPSRGRKPGPRKAAVLARADAPAPHQAKPLEVEGKLRAKVLVRAGDSLWGIAQKFGVAVDELCRWNGIRNPRRFKLQIGRELVVYARREAASAAPAGTPRPG